MHKLELKKMAKAYREVANQRKEENKTFYANNLKALTDEQNIAELIVDSSDSNCIDGYFHVDKDEYKLVKFYDVIFGKGKAMNEDDLVKVSGVCFYYCGFSMCGFSNIHFENCTFVGCDFIECYTLGMIAVFSNCSFLSRLKGKKSIDDMPSLFESCEFTIKLINCDVSQLVFDKTHFYFTNFENVCLYDSIFLDCSFDTMKICGCDLRNTKIVNPKFIEFNIEDLDKKTKVSRNTFLGSINYSKKEKREVRYAVEVYDAFSELFENSKIMDYGGEYFFLSQKTEIGNMNGFTKLKSILSYITCGYGERPSFSLMVAMALVILCGTLYLLFGVTVNNEVISFKPSLENLFPSWDKLILCYHFSLVTFSTVGYGNVVPIGGSILVSAVEMVLGVIMVGIWVSTLVRKMTRN
ncbi:MAG TPA: ion channel [Ruminiclostridium sp.]